MSGARKGPALCPAYVIALCALFAALGAAVMLTGGLIPVMTYCSPLIAGLLLIPILTEFGSGRAWMTWAATALLALLLSADKEAAFFYLFLGCYPILKQRLDRLPGRILRFLVKLVYFAAALALMYGLLYFVLGLETVVNDLNAAGMVLNIALYIALVAAMMIFDLAIRNVTLLYMRRLRPHLKFLK